MSDHNIIEEPIDSFETEKWSEIQNSHMLRALDLANIGLAKPDATVDDLIAFGKALCEVADEKIDISEFAEKLNLTGQERLN